MQHENRVFTEEKYLTFNGYASDAYQLVESIRGAYDQAGMDMPKVLNDFVFSIEVSLQNIGFLNDVFEKEGINHAI